MNLNYDALQELYDTLMFGPVLSSPYAESPIDRAFKECDEKLSESIAFDFLKKLQDRIEVLERTNKDLRDNNDKVSDKVIGLNKKNEQLEKDIDAKSKENSALVSTNADLSDRNAHLQRNYERIDRLWTSQIRENMELRSKITDLQESKPKLVDYETLRKELDDAKEDRDAWRRRATYAEKDRDLAKRNSDGWKSRAKHAEKRYAELRKENADLSDKIVALQKKGDELTKKGEDLQQEIEELKKSRKCYRQLHVGEGARKLWEMLQEVSDYYYFGGDDEFDTDDCKMTSMTDIIDNLNVDQFLEAYKNWHKTQDQFRLDHMRNWLAYFCEGRDCKGCPLESNEYKCGCGYSFKRRDESDTRIIPDEDIKRYYEKARGDGDETFYFDNQPVKMGNGKIFIHDLSNPTERVNRGISKACEEFRKAVLDADNKITENLRKGCTLEAKVEVNKDLLATVCGIKPKEEDHELEYGDAVRVPWRDYDYMYIGPEGKHIRLFNPKTHNVVIVPATENLPYQGCKIILYNEDDIRKIWKDKK